VSYAVEWTPGVAFLGTLLVLLIVPHFALIALLVALAAVAALFALAAAVLAMPYRARAQPPPPPR
jgi:hypothetical protein